MEQGLINEGLKIYRIELIALPEQPAFIEADNIDAVAQYVIYSGEIMEQASKAFGK